MIYKAKSSLCNESFETRRYVFQLLLFYFRLLRVKNFDDHFHLKLNSMTENFLRFFICFSIMRVTFTRSRRFVFMNDTFLIEKLIQIFVDANKKSSFWFKLLLK